MLRRFGFDGHLMSFCGFFTGMARQVVPTRPSRDPTPVNDLTEHQEDRAEDPMKLPRAERGSTPKRVNVDISVIQRPSSRASSNTGESASAMGDAHSEETQVWFTWDVLTIYYSLRKKNRQYLALIP